MRHVAHVIPLFWPLVLATAVIAIGELALLAIAARRQPGPAEGGTAAASEKRPSAWFAVAAIAGPVVLAGLIAARSASDTRPCCVGLPLPGPTRTSGLSSPAWKPSGMRRRWGRSCSAPYWSGHHCGEPARRGDLERPSAPPGDGVPFFVGAGLSPFIWGTFKYATQTIKVLAGVAGVDVAMKAVMITKGLEETLELLDWWAMFGTVGFGLALVVAIVLTVRDGVGPASPRVSWRSSALCLAAAAGLFLAAEPLRAENTTPWPASPSLGAALTNNVVATPDVDGPDEFSPAELVTVTNDLTLEGGVTRNSEELRNALVVMRNNYRLLHPDEWGGDENLVIICPPETRTERLIEIAVGQAHGVPAPRVRVREANHARAPADGDAAALEMDRRQGADPRRRPQGPTPIVTLTVDDYPTCDAVARAVTAIRRGGKIAGLAF